MFCSWNSKRIQSIEKHLELHFVVLMGKQLSKKMECQNTSYPYRSQRSYITRAGVEIEKWSVLWKSYLMLLFANISENRSWMLLWFWHISKISFQKRFIWYGGILSFLLILKIKINEHIRNFFKVSVFQLWISFTGWIFVTSWFLNLAY